MVRFSTLWPDGSETDIREMDQSVFGTCPFVIMVPEHYDNPPPGKPCKCYDPIYRKTVMRAWGYAKKDFIKADILK